MSALSLRHPAVLLATWFGVGLIPKAPGTWGSLAALPLAYLVQVNFGNTALVGVAGGIFLLGCVVSEIYVRKTGRNDPKEVVIDEVAGQCLLLGVMYPTLVSYFIGFLLFRLFDVLKPWPISWLDRKIHGGLGVMIDDIFAAFAPVALTLLALLAASYFSWPLTLDGILQFLKETHVF